MSSELQALRNLASGFRTGIEQARAERAAGALPYFPEGACRLTSRLFALHLARQPNAVTFGGARLVSGVLPQSDLGARHYWLELDDTVVDLTADAFGQPAVVVGESTAFHDALTARVSEPVAENLASLSADDMARLTRQLAAIEQRMPAIELPGEDMEWNEMSPEQQKEIEADHADFERQLVRTAVDLRAASPRLHKIKAPKYGELTIEDDVESFTMSITVDFSGILETLRQLPDGAGTAAFVAAYNAAHPDWRDVDSQGK